MQKYANTKDLEEVSNPTQQHLLTDFCKTI
jgi:hypothetical protein